MSPLLLSSVKFVASSIAGHYISKEYEKLTKPDVKLQYQNKIEEHLMSSIEEHRKIYPYNGVKLKFYEHKDGFNILSNHILIKPVSKDSIIQQLNSIEEILQPSLEELNSFYSRFMSKIENDNSIKTLYLNANYEEIILDIGKELTSISVRLDSIESKIEEKNVLISKTDNVVISIDRLLETVLERHIGVTNRIKRSRDVMNLSTALNSTAWLHVYGPVSCGKTELIHLLIESLESEFIWMNLSHSSAFDYVKIINEGLKRMNYDEYGIHRETILVIDGLPTIEKSLSIRFAALVEDLINRGFRIVSTSNYSISINFLERLRDSQVTILKCPEIDEIDIKEMLDNFECHSALEDWTKLITARSSGNPFIAKSLCQYAKSINWQLDMDAIESIIVKSYSDESGNEIINNLINSTEDSNALELLFRLKLIIGSFSSIQLAIVSSVNPEMADYIRVFHKLIGKWIISTGKDKYLLSPLVSEIPSDNLTGQKIREISYLLAKEILGKDGHSPIDITNVIIYLLKAKAYNEMAQIFLQVLHKAISDPSLFFNWGFSGFWKETKLPADIRCELRLQIRITQIAIYSKEQNIPKSIPVHLEELVEEAKSKKINIGLACASLALYYGENNPKKALKYLQEGITDYKLIEKNIDPESKLGSLMSAHEILWMNATYIEGLEDIKSWFETFDNLNKEEKDLVRFSDNRYLICEIIVTRISEKYVSSNNDKNLIIALEEVKSLASIHGLISLEAYAIAKIIGVLFADTNDPKSAIRIHDEFVGKFSSYQNEVLITSGSLGRNFFYTGNIEAAKNTFEKISFENIHSANIEFVYSLRVMAEISSNINLEEANKHLARAIDFSRENEFVVSLVMSHLWCEYSTSLWHLNQRKEAVLAMEKAYELIIDTFQDLDEYKAAIIRFGHNINYYQSILSTGSPPEKDINGEKYMIPFIGMFSKDHTRLLDGGYYVDTRKYTNGYLLISCLEHLEKFDLSTKWAHNLYEIAGEVDTGVFSILFSSIAPYFILNNLEEEMSITMLQAYGNTPKDIGNNVNPELTNWYKSEFKISPEMKDASILNFVVLPYILKEAKDNIETKGVEWLLPDNEPINKLCSKFTNEDISNRIIKLLTIFSDPDSSTADIQSFSTQLKGQQDITHGIGYLLASMKGDAKTAYSAQIHVAPWFDNFRAASPSLYHLFAVPFFEEFWFDRIENNSGEFSDYDKLLSRGLKKIKATNNDQKLRAIFDVLQYHLDVSPSIEQEDWITSYHV